MQHICASKGYFESARLLLNKGCKFYYSSVTYTRFSLPTTAGQVAPFAFGENGVIFDMDFVNPFIIPTKATALSKQTELCSADFIVNGAIASDITSLYRSSANTIQIKNKPLHVAAAYGHIEICELLLQNNAILNEGNMSTGNTPLHLAVMNGHVETARLFLNFGTHHGQQQQVQTQTVSKMNQVDIEPVDINATNVQNLTPLAVAAYLNLEGCVKLLLQSPFILLVTVLLSYLNLFFSFFFFFFFFFFFLISFSFSSFFFVLNRNLKLPL